MSAADGTVVGTTLIVDHGSPADRFNLVLVAEGYQQGELPHFATDAQQFVDFLFQTPPFDALKCTLNVYRIDVASNESGADDPTDCGGTGATPATYFDAHFCNSNIQRLLLCDSGLVQTVVNAQVPQWHQIIVIVNSAVYGGSGGVIATTSTSGSWERIAVHEIGHSAFGLADEYPSWVGCGFETNRDNHPAFEPAEPNVTIDNNRATIKWGDLIDSGTPMPTTSNPDCTLCDTQANPVAAGTVGAFEGADHYHCDAFRSQYDCMMRNYQPFCAVCSRAIRQTLSPFLADCYAPVFSGASGIACLFKIIAGVIALVFLALLLWIPGVRCVFSQIAFRLRNCRSGNQDPCQEL